MNDEAQQAFREFALARTPALLRTAYLLTGGQHDAEDLVQTALARAMARWRHIRHRDPESYVRRIMYHEQVSWWRRRARRREFPTDPMPEQTVADPNTATDLRLSVHRILRQSGHAEQPGTQWSAGDSGAQRGARTEWGAGRTAAARRAGTESSAEPSGAPAPSGAAHRDR